MMFYPFRFGDKSADGFSSPSLSVEKSAINSLIYLDNAAEKNGLHSTYWAETVRVIRPIAYLSD
ncbi:hypothetical protein BSK71_04120 [Pectobacterium actinidiae]|uniref:Uncharacterized protein n=1 Tax=Pectobacterium actinidiae TaxID=1507808 RepID=A0A1V2R7T7_9GAMM|nr:hypothetical protein BSK69_10045 [Pectobacterium actinidiae]ONK08425.1 hypothetical protein BSK71_04120 [Pectobacterium actinidiae]